MIVSVANPNIKAWFYRHDGVETGYEDFWQEHNRRPGVPFWLDLQAEPDAAFKEMMQMRLGIHPIALKSLFDDVRHPRMLEFADHFYMGFKVVVAGPGPDNAVESSGLHLTFLSLVLGPHFIITAHLEPLSLLDRTLERLKANANQVQSVGTGRLLYLLLDSLVDDYFDRLDELAEAIDDIDARATELTVKPDRQLQHDILDSKRQLLAMHQAIAPLRDALLNMRRTDGALIGEANELYLRDIFEHILQLLDTIETYREVLSNTTELIMSAASNRMNEIMTFLTVFTTFFIPLNFIAGFYGMNLIMPENRQAVTYPIVIVIMLLLILGMFLWFRRKKWL